MRRILWTLAASTAFSATGAPATADDPFSVQGTAGNRGPAGYAQPNTGRANVTFSGTPTAGGTNSIANRSYAELFGNQSADPADVRPFPETQQTLPRAGSLSDTRASDLFRREAPAARTSASDVLTRGMEDDGFRQVSGQQAGPGRRVVHAEYERQPGQGAAIQQVTGNSQAPEFPSVTPPSNPEISSDETRYNIRPSTESFNNRFTSGNSRLSEPIPTTGRGGFDGNRSLPPLNQSSRGVTFQRSAPETQTASLPVTRQSQSSQATRFAASPVTTTPAVTQRVETDALGALSQRVHSGPQSPTVSVEWVTRNGINVGQECDCDLVVKNTGIIPASNVEVATRFPASVRLVTVEPQPAETEESLLWKFAKLEPGEERSIHIRLVPSERGTLNTEASVRFSGTAATSLTVAEPLLEIVTEGPEKVLIGEPASQTVLVRNPGSGIATNVQIEAIIPDGLEHARGSRLIMDVGSLNPGETRSVRLALAAVKGGRQVVQVQGRADGDLVRNSQNEVFVVAPSIVTEIEGPGLRYLGRNATYTLRVRNDGEINVENVRVMHKMPEGFEVVETDRGAQFDRGNRLVNWFVGRLASGATSEMKVTVRADQIGSFTHFVRATSEHGAVSDAQYTTQVEGTPSLTLEIRDLDDPVELGNETAYEIVVRNSGSAPARSVSLACEIPAGVEVLKAQGPVDSIKQRDLVTFNPVVELAPGNSVTYRVHVRGTVIGHHRLRARLSSDSTPEQLTADELTRFYGE